MGSRIGGRTGRMPALMLGAVVAAAALGVATPAVASAAPVPAAAGGDAPCGRSFVFPAQRWHNCESAPVLIGIVAYDGPSEEVFNTEQCVPAGETRFLLPTFVVMHSFLAGRGC